MVSGLFSLGMALAYGLYDMESKKMDKFVNSGAAEKILDIILGMLDRPASVIFAINSTVAEKLEYFRSNYPAEWIYANAKVRRVGKSVNVLGAIGLDAVKSALDEGRRATLLIRHAERPPLDPSDTSFGEMLPITEHGRMTAERFGAALAGIVSPDLVKFYSSQTFRTIQTACAMSKGLGAASGGSTSRHDVRVDDVLGGDTPFFGPLDERMALIAEGRYMERLNEYYRTGTQKGYKPLGPATEAMEHALDRLHRGRSGLVVAVTHDINVASFLAGRGVVVEYDNATWPHYLDAAVLVEDCVGGVGYGVLRHSQIPRNDGA